MSGRLCEKCGQTKSDDISLFRFPKLEEYKKKWVEFVGKESFVLKVNSVLCSLHFKESDIKKGKTRTRLMRGALPRKEDRHQEPFQHPIFQGVQEGNLNNEFALRI